MKENNPTQISSAITADQLKQHGLRINPFTENIETALLYTDSHLEMTSNVILKSLANDTKAILLISEKGTGKTTFLRKLLHMAYLDYSLCTCRIRRNLNFQDIVDKIKQKWSLTNIAEPQLELSCENHLICYLQENPKLILLIDDAHLLDLASLAELFQLKHRIEQTHPNALGLVLTGESDLKLKIIKLEDANPVSRANYQINIRPLNREQTHRYLHYRIEHALLDQKTDANTILNSSDMDIIYKFSHGNFDQLHDNAISALTDTSLRTNSQMAKKKSKFSLFAIIGSILALALLLYYLRNSLI